MLKWCFNVGNNQVSAEEKVRFEDVIAIHFTINSKISKDLNFTVKEKSTVLDEDDKALFEGEKVVGSSLQFRNALNL